MAKHRITALDGIRGFAIFLVVINHLNYSGINDKVAGATKFIWNTVLLNGPFGVNIFFILCGFLMAFLYPQINHPLNFIAKRYMRIFPLFLTVCTFNMLIFINKNIPVIVQLISLIITGVFVHLVWIKQLSKKNYQPLIKIVIKMFLALQAIMILVNIAIGRLSAEQFVHLPSLVKNIVIYLANLTLTLWAGWNIPILSGPYWSLAPEVLFYLVYPLALLIFIHRLKKITWTQIFFILIISAVSLFILNEVFSNILALSRLNIVRSYAFVVGILVAMILRNENQWLALADNLKNKWFQLTAILIIPTSLILYPFFPEENQFSLNILHVISNSLMFIVFLLTLVEGSLLNRFFSHKWLLFLGLISYPAYLIHSTTISWLNTLIKADSSLKMLIYIIFSFMITLPLAYLLHYLVERPYFNNKEAHNFPVK